MPKQAPKKPRCECHLVPTMRRLYPEVAGKVRRCTSPDPAEDEHRFYNHMMVEEQLLFPKLPAEQRLRLQRDHDLMVQLLRSGQEVPERLLVQHAAEEAEAFSKL